MSSAQNSSSETGLIRVNRFSTGRKSKEKQNVNFKTIQPKKTKFKETPIIEPTLGSDLNSSGEEERNILIIDSNMTSKTSSLNSANTAANTMSTTATLSLRTQSLSKKYLSNQTPLMVLVPNDRKMVASTESLSSLNSSNLHKTSTLNDQENFSPNHQVLTPASSASQQSSSAGSSITSQELSLRQNHNHKPISSPNNFKTFKAITNSPSPPNTQEYSYRTMPVNGYRNLVSESIVNSPTQTPTKINGFDQKPLNLPVNELFRRYELKKQASSGSLASINTSNNSTPHRNESKIYSSPRTTQKLINQIKLNIEPKNSINHGQVPDYFFKDEKEFKKFLAQNNKQKLNCKHIIDPQQNFKPENNIL